MSTNALAKIRADLRTLTNAPDREQIDFLLTQLDISKTKRIKISEVAEQTVRRIRAEADAGLMETFLAEYGLDTDEGIALMCLAEAYLRTPDSETLDALISDKIGEGDWARHLGKASSSLVNASTWALMLTGKVFKSIPAKATDLSSTMHSMVQRLGEPVARTAVGEAMKILGQQFVLGRTIDEALTNAVPLTKDGYLHSFDMLGEAARTSKDAKRYFLSYSDAISKIAKYANSAEPHKNHGISIKLSALHPRYETTNKERVLKELVPRVAALAQTAKAANIPLAIDAEEADRLDLSLDVIEAVLSNPGLKDWDGFGVVVQAYSKRCPKVLDWLYELTKVLDYKISVRLVKGAYWDAEIKNAQILGINDYPVFTRKESTDISYLSCAKQLLSMADRIYPQFATHNAHTVTAIEAIADKSTDFEFQRLHGMGESLHEICRQSDQRQRRIYAPVGIHKDLLAYLVRRLLENGANSSFVNQLQDKSVDPKTIVADPIAKLQEYTQVAHAKIPLPRDIFGSVRTNSKGWNLNDPAELDHISNRLEKWKSNSWLNKGKIKIRNPALNSQFVGALEYSSKVEIKAAIKSSQSAFLSWQKTQPNKRATMLKNTAQLIEKNYVELMALIIREAGKTRFDAVAEIREAVDFLNYYALQAETELSGQTPIGPIVCISPWNFPCAIFTGQISAQLAAGNTVIAKPAEQTPLIAKRVTELFHQAGIPNDALILVNGQGANIGPSLTASTEISGVAFTGSTQTARLIDISMASGNSNAGLIAETGGLNAMIVDSTALPEQAIRDIVASAFQSAGQRCSALRVLYVQKDVTPQLLEMLEGASQELRIGDPWHQATDVGPIIDQPAREKILNHCEKLKNQGQLLFEIPLNDECANGSFVSPIAFRLNHIDELDEEIFGPVLHVIEYEANELEAVISQINAKGYGLTLGIHSRIDTRVDEICEKAEIGNIYVNRNQIGAVVGVQPFGGEGLSGTGPKAGGPFYTKRFMKSPSGALPVEREMLLNGPTGERNTWSCKAKGLILCIGESEQSTLNLVDLAKDIGSDFILPSNDAELDDLLNNPDIDLVISDKKDISAIRKTLAKRVGKRILVINPFENPEMLFSEKTVSEDTTASGGNASLLASVG